MVRFMLSYDNRRHLVYNDFKKCNCLNVNSRMQYLSLNLMYNIYNNTAPSYFTMFTQFRKIRDVHTHDTRNSSFSYFVPQVASQGLNTFNYNGIREHLKIQ